MPRNYDDSYRQESADQQHEWTGPERRQWPTNKALVAEIICAINETHKPLTDEERQWVRLAIQREAQSIKLRQAIIEKSLTALIWAGIVGFFSVLYEYLKAHGWKP